MIKFKPNPSALLLTLVLSGLSGLASAEQWTTYESREFDVQFSIPAHWHVELDGDQMVAQGNNIIFVLAAVKDSTISNEELFDIQVEELHMDAVGESEYIQLHGGIEGVIGSGVAVLEGEPVGLVLLAAIQRENNYLAYIFTAPESYQHYEETMVNIVTSLAPLGWRY